MKRFISLYPALTLLVMTALGGCTSISVAPSCPNELRVNESAPLHANEVNPGAIAKYDWEVIPPEIGQVADATKASTTFKATAEGEAVVRLTASDGLYQVISQCRIVVAGVAQPPAGSDNGNSNGNANDNTNSNTNENDNDNNNGNDNSGGNTNDNTDEVKDDNSNDNGGRPSRPGRKVRAAPR